MSEDSNNNFTFSVEGKKYVINEKTDLKEPKKNTIHGPSVIIGVAITAICVIGIFFSLNLNDAEESLIEREIIDTKTIPEATEISMSTFFNNAAPNLGNPNASITLITCRRDPNVTFCKRSSNVFLCRRNHNVILCQGNPNVVICRRDQCN